MPIANRLIINLTDDWAEFVTSFLYDKGYRVSANKNKTQIGILFYNLVLMRISSKSRQVHISKEFYCPPMYKKRLKKLVEKIQTGENLTPYLSPRADDPTNKDYLLYDWGIHHLHLRKQKNNQEFSKRRDDLLFVYTTEAAMYFLNVLDHNSFADKQLLSTIHNNWPWLIKSYLVQDATGINPDIPDEAIHPLRKNGGIAFTQLDGEVYMPPGLGLVTTADSTKAVRYTIGILN